MKIKRKPQRDAPAKESADDELRWGMSDIVALCLAMFDTIGPGLLVIAGIMIVLSLIITLAQR